MSTDQSCSQICQASGTSSLQVMHSTGETIDDADCCTLQGALKDVQRAVQMQPTNGKWMAAMAEKKCYMGDYKVQMLTVRLEQDLAVLGLHTLSAMSAAHARTGVRMP